MADDQKRGAAVYVGWATFKNAIEQLAQGLPNRIDRTCFPGQAGGVQSQLLAALKFLALTDDDGKPTKSLQALAVATDEAARKEQLKKILQEQYAEVFALDLMKTTPGELAEKMTEAYGVSGETKEKAIRFFLSAASYIGIPLSQLLTKAKPSTMGGGNSAPRRRRATAKSRGSDDEDEGDEGQAPGEGGTPASGTSRVVNLASGGTLTIAVSLDVLRLSASDRKFVFDLIDKLEEYEQSGAAAAK